MIRQELNPVTCKLDTTVEKCRYAWLIRPCITRETRASSLVVDSGPCYHPLHYLKKGEEGRKRRKFYIYPDVTHTHTRQSRENPERQEEEKSGHTTGRRPKKSAGGRGEQTDLRNQPTRRNGPDQNSAHT